MIVGKINMGLIFILTLSSAFAQKQILSNAKKVELLGFENLYQVSEYLYRSEQPTAQGMTELETLGIKTVINLRSKKNDNKEARNTSFVLSHIPINTWIISECDLIDALKAIQQSNKPIIIHCLHGSDRTGAVVAVYRIIFDDWSKQKAIAEFLDPQFGYHVKWFPNILRLLELIDIDKVKKELEIQTKIENSI